MYRNKTTVILFLLLISPFAGLCQNWLPIGSEWSFSIHVFGGGLWGTNQLLITDTATVLGQPVCVLKRRSGSCDQRPDTEYMFKRNDSLFYYEAEINDFRLLYDFGAEQGDTFKIAIWDFMGKDTLYVIIDSTSFFSFDTLTLKKYYATYGYFYEWEKDSFRFFTDENIVIIEDIGSLVNMFHLVENGACDADWNDELRCFTHPTLGTIKFTSDRCSIPVGVTPLPLQRQNLELYPNPATNQIVLRQLDQEISEISIYTTHGTRLKFWDSLNPIGLKKEQEIILNLSDLKPGFYLLEISNQSDQTKIVRNFVKL